MPPSPAWHVRITGHGEETPDQILANPWNFKIHSTLQKDTIKGSLDELGWLRPILINTRTQHCVDGHARVACALERGEASVPVDYCDLSEQEEQLALSILDPVIAKAGYDDALLAALLEETVTENQTLQRFLDALAQEHQGVTMHHIPMVPQPVPGMARERNLGREPLDTAAARGETAAPAMQPMSLRCPHCHETFTSATS